MMMKSQMAVRLAGFAGATAMAQEQSPFQTPVPVVATTQAATVDSPMILNLSGVTITDQTGQPLGPLQHILLSPAGCVDMAVMSLGGQKLVPIPWRLVTGAGATRGETAVAGQATLSVNVDRTQLLQGPSFPATQLTLLTQPQTVQRVNSYYGMEASQSQSQAQSQTQGQTGAQIGVGGTGAQTNAVGGTVITTNRVGSVGITNQTNGLLSPTGPTNAIPGRPAFETNRPGQPSITPPANRPPTNRPPSSIPGQPGQP